MQVITKSRLYAARKCKRFHKLRYIDGVRLVAEAEPSAFGTLFHRAAEAYWKGEPVTLKCDDPVLLIKVEEVARAYAWADRDDYEVVEVERAVTWPLINPATMLPSRTFQMGGVIDLVLRRKSTGQHILVEHKTTGSDFSDDAADYWKRLDMDPQLSIYVVACESLSIQIERIIYDVAARPMLKRKLATPVADRKFTKDGRLYAGQREADETLDEFRMRLRTDIAERPDRYFGRREIARMESQVRDGMLDTWDEARAIRDAELSGRHPRNPDACHNMGTCEFFDICAYGVEPSGSPKYRIAVTTHEEMSK